MRRLLALSLLLLPAATLAASPASSSEPLGLMAVPAQYSAQLQTLQLMVEGGTRSDLHVHGTQSDRALLDGAGVPYTVLTTDLRTLRPHPGVGARDAEYHTPETMAESLRTLAATYPEIARVVDVGTSWEGREITALVLSADAGTRVLSRPSYRILGTHHGDEWSSMEVAWSVAWALAGGFGSDIEASALLMGSEVWIVPVVNPDGVAAFTRRNSRQVDLNRNYGFEWISQTASGSAPFSERETDAVRLLSRQRSFGHSLTMHSGATNFGWVWNWSLAPTDDDSVLEEIAELYQSRTAQPDFWITNGAAWYITRGDTNDWSYGIRGGHDYTVELSDVKAPPEDELEQFLDWHTEPSVRFLIDGFQSGIRGGVLTDELSRGVEATLVSDLDPWPLYSDPETGGFSRPFGPGTHTFTVTAQGYQDGTFIAEVGPLGEGPPVVTVQLVPVSELAIEGAQGLSSPADTVGTATLCGVDVLSHAGNGGTFALHRPGLGVHLADSSIVSGPEPCVAVALDAGVIPNAWDEVGEWTLLFQNATGDSVASRELAVLFATPDHVAVEDLTITDQDAETALLQVHGAGLPEGAQLRFVGPDAVRRLPSKRLPDGGTDTTGVPSLSAEINFADWPEGSYAVRVLGGGEFFALQGALLLEDGALTSTYVPPIGDDDDDTTASDDDDSGQTDDDDSGQPDDDDATDPPAPPPPSGCTGCGGGAGSGTLALLALITPLSLRRRRTH